MESITKNKRTTRSCFNGLIFVSIMSETISRLSPWSFPSLSCMHHSFYASSNPLDLGYGFARVRQIKYQNGSQCCLQGGVSGNLCKEWVLQ